MERRGDLIAWGRRLACHDTLRPADFYWRLYGAAISVLAMALPAVFGILDECVTASAR